MCAASRHKLSFRCLGVTISIDCDDRALYAILKQNFAGMTTSEEPGALEYDVRLTSDRQEFSIARRRSEFRRSSRNAGELIYLLEGDLVVQLQLLRADLLFLHAAVVACDDQAHVLVGRSGAGKSTTCWGLLHHGFDYVSDELAPIALDRAVVSPYSHALCMKTPPPAEYPVPEAACVTERGWHIPPAAMPCRAMTSELPVRSVCFIEYQPDLANPVMSSVGPAEAATRLYPNILNALAHSNDGLDAALQLTRTVHCYRIDAANMTSTCEMIRQIATEAGSPPVRRPPH